MFGAREHVEAGGLMSYGANIPDQFRRSADFVDKILRGTKPGDIPIEQPTKFGLVINLTTAKALGLTLPPLLLAIAEEVIYRISLLRCRSPDPADAVEKVRGIRLTRNNRIIRVDFLNRTCVFDVHFESILLRDHPKIFFRQHRPIPTVVGSRCYGSYPALSCQVRVTAGSIQQIDRPLLRLGREDAFAPDNRISR